MSPSMDSIAARYMRSVRFAGAAGRRTATISRVKKFVEYGTDGYRDVLRKLESKAAEEEAPKKKSVKK